MLMLTVQAINIIIKDNAFKISILMNYTVKQIWASSKVNSATSRPSLNCVHRLAKLSDFIFAHVKSSSQASEPLQKFGTL